MYTTPFVDVPLENLLERVQTIKHEGVRFVQLFAEKNADDSLDVVYTFYNEVEDHALNLVVQLPEDARVPSIQGLYFASFSYENEAHDLFGVRFANMKLDFGGHFFNVAQDAPMTIISPEQKAAREKAAKLAAAKAAKEAKAAREAAEAAAAKKAEEQTPAQADAEAVAKVNELAPKVAKPVDPAKPAEPAAEAALAPAGVDDRTAKMLAKIAALEAKDPEKAAKLRENLAARGIDVSAPATSKDGE